MKINSELGYKPVTFSELTQDEAFWSGCQSCPNFHILQAKERKLCLCTGMLAPSKMESMGLDLTEMIIQKQSEQVNVEARQGGEERLFKKPVALVW